MQVPNSTDFGISIEKTVFVSVIGHSCSQAKFSSHQWKKQ